MIYIKFNSEPSVNKSYSVSAFRKIFLFIIRYIFPKANPDFDNKIDDVRIWFLEFENTKDFPNREIGIDSNDNVIVKMPYKKNYGYWIDNNLKFDDFNRIFTIEYINQVEFDNKWNEI
jgi:hypothetical protein